MRACVRAFPACLACLPVATGTRLSTPALLLWKAPYLTQQADGLSPGGTLRARSGDGTARLLSLLHSLPRPHCPGDKSWEHKARFARVMLCWGLPRFPCRGLSQLLPPKLTRTRLGARRACASLSVRRSAGETAVSEHRVEWSWYQAQRATVTIW